MGVSTDAYLYYGIDIWDADTRSDLPDLPLNDDGDEQRIDDFLDEHAEKWGLKYGSHCSDDCPIYFVYAHLFHAWRGYPAQVPNLLADPEQLKEWDEKLRAFCKQFGFTYKQPTWHLASYWG